ncbi:MAG TPA: citrate/2-methylcitrate synthase [Planctomycetaceae bacterium]|nr:citrate/2-methylcitrate synthase [Planctomycetaceae bacterium]
MTTAVAKGKPVSTANKGLKGVIAADSAVCEVDGLEGRLIYRGYNIHELADHSTFEEVCFLLLKGDLPTRAELTAFTRELAEYRRLSPAVLAFLKSLPRDVLPMSALRSAVSVAGICDPQAEETTPAAQMQVALRLIGMMSTLVAAIHRLREGLEPLEPKLELGHSANFMYLLNGRVPSADETRAMDLILILHAEHGFNASTFAARVISATLSDWYSVIVGAIGALKGPLHGGANTEVIRTLMEIGEVSKVTDYVEAVKAKKGKFMGFGHAVYQVEDPRARHLKELSRRLGIEKGEPKWYDISVELEGQVKESIQKNCNVDFYSASLQHYMGIPGELFTCIFAASRIAGWCAHVLEQWQDNQIIRPSSNSTGPEERRYVAVDKR